MRLRASSERAILMEFCGFRRMRISFGCGPVVQITGRTEFWIYGGVKGLQGIRFANEVVDFLENIKIHGEGKNDGQDEQKGSVSLGTHI